MWSIEFPICAPEMVTGYPDTSVTVPFPFCPQQCSWFGRDPGPWLLDFCWVSVSSSKVDMSVVASGSYQILSVGMLAVASSEADAQRGLADHLGLMREDREMGPRGQIV